MAYRVMYGASTLYEPGIGSRAIHGARLSQKADGFSTFVFTMPPGHDMYDIVAMYDAANPIEVYFDNTMLFRGTVSGIKETLSLEREIECESEIAYLDRVYTRYQPTNKGAATALAELIAIYNSYANLWGGAGVEKFLFAVDPTSLAFQVGYMDPTEQAIVVDAETSSPSSILQIIKSKILDPYDAFLRVRYVNGQRLIGIYPNAPDTSTQVVRFGENLLDYEYTVSDEEMFNACYPVGGRAEEMEPEEPKYLVLASDVAAESHTISVTAQSGTVHVRGDGILLLQASSIALQSYVVENVPGGAVDIGSTPVSLYVDPAIAEQHAAGNVFKYVGYAPFFWDSTLTLARIPPQTVSNTWAADTEIVYHIASAAAHGIKAMTMQDSNIEDANALLNKAIAVLQGKTDFTASLKISALDMAFYMDGYEHLQVGQRLRVVSEPHGLDATMFVVTADIDLDDPSMTKYVLGNRDRSVSKRIRANEESVRALKDNFIVELNNISRQLS